jgi:uncharacterized protein
VTRLFAVIRARGPAWNASLPLERQAEWDAHAVFMEGLVAVGFITVGGPLEGTSDTLLIARATDETEITMRLAADPWTQNGVLIVRNVVPWQIRLGSVGAPTRGMTENTKTVERYLDGFRASDHAQILSCLTDDVVWNIPGVFHVVGKDAFDREIENDAFVGSPVITLVRMVEENDVVVAEGAVRAQRRDGGVLDAVFCDVFEMANGRIKRLTTYLAEVT